MKTRHALLVANAAFADPRLRQLRTPVHDVHGLAAVLSDPSVGGFDVREPLIDRTESDLRRELSRFLARAAEQDTLLIYLACHGLRDSDGHLYLSAADTDTQDLPATAIPAEFIGGLMRRSPAGRAVLILDCCFSGAATAAMSSPHLVDLGQMGWGQGIGRAIITATSAEEYAWERSSAPFRPYEGVAGTAFAEAITEGLRTGAADLDGDGRVSVGELYEYLQRRMARAATQTPGLWCHLLGSLVVARAGSSPPRGDRSTTATGARGPTPWDAATLDWRHPRPRAAQGPLSTEPPTPAEARGWHMLHVGNWPAARAAFAEAISEDRASPAVWWGHGVARAESEEWEAAADSFEHAADLSATAAAEIAAADSAQRTALLEISASAFLLGASCWAAIPDLRAAEVIERGLGVAPACAELLAFRSVLVNDDRGLGAVLSRQPDLVDEFRAVDADLVLPLRAALLASEARAGPMLRARARVDQVSAALRAPSRHPPAIAVPERLNPDVRLTRYRVLVAEQRTVLAAEIERLNRTAVDLLGGPVDQETLNLVGAVREAVGVANDALGATDEPESIRARPIPPRRMRPA